MTQPQDMLLSDIPIPTGSVQKRLSQ